LRPNALIPSLLAYVGDSGPVDRGALLERLQGWLKAHLANWSVELRNRWGLNELSDIELGAYPIEDASLDPEEELRQLNAVPPTSMENLAMRIHDIFWVGITVESTVTCPRCGELQLLVLEDPRSSEIVLSCDLCAWTQTSTGEPLHGAPHLKPASRTRIEQWNRGRTL